MDTGVMQLSLPKLATKCWYPIATLKIAAIGWSSDWSSVVGPANFVSKELIRAASINYSTKKGSAHSLTANALRQNGRHAQKKK